MSNGDIEAVPRDALFDVAGHLTADGLALKALTDHDKASGTSLPTSWADRAYTAPCFALRLAGSPFFALVSWDPCAKHRDHEVSWWLAVEARSERLPNGHRHSRATVYRLAELLIAAGIRQCCVQNRAKPHIFKNNKFVIRNFVERYREMGGQCNYLPGDVAEPEEHWDDT